MILHLIYRVDNTCSVSQRVWLAFLETSLLLPLIKHKMKYLSTFSLLLVLSSCLAQHGPSTSHKDDFKLTYIYAGLGSGIGSKQPAFRVTGKKYLYTLDQNSFYDEKTLEPDTICSGDLRQSSIDSIIDLTQNINDTLVYNTNAHIMSGGIHIIEINYTKIDLTFRLHNASDPIAEKIIAILNANLPEDVDRLWLFHLPKFE